MATAEGNNVTANGDPFKEATYKILVLGDSAVGKTCLIYRYCDREFYESYISTIGKIVWFMILVSVILDV